MSTAPDPVAAPPPLPGPAPHRRRDLVRTLRSLRALSQDPLGFVDRRFAEFGDLYHVDEGGGSHLLVTRHPDHLHQVLVREATAFRKRGGANDRLAAVLGDGLVTSDGETWKRQRRLIQPAFRHAAIAGYAESMVARAAALSWPAGGEIDLGPELMRLTLGIVCKALFDHEVTGDTDAIAATMASLNAAIGRTLLPDWVPTPTRFRLRRAKRTLHGIVDALVDERQRAASGSEERRDLLSMLVATGMPREALRDEVVTLFLAGHETTSHALTWTFALLSSHPDVEARLVDELGAVLGDRDPTHADLDRLPFTAAVVDEALRLYPTAYVVARVADRDTRIGDWPVPAGWQVTCWIWHCHRDARWFEEPDAFRPDRFAGALRHSDSAYLPFAAGSRMCIGAGFARMELRLLVATLVRRWRLRLVGPFPSPRPRVTLAPSSAVRMRVERR